MGQNMENESNKFHDQNEATQVANLLNNVLNKNKDHILCCDDDLEVLKHINKVLANEFRVSCTSRGSAVFQSKRPR